MKSKTFFILLVIGLVITSVLGLSAIAVFVSRQSEPQPEPIAIDGPEATEDRLPPPLQRVATATPTPKATATNTPDLTPPSEPPSEPPTAPPPAPTETATLLPTLIPTDPINTATPDPTATSTATPAVMPPVTNQLSSGQTVFFAQDDALLRGDPVGATLDVLTSPNFLGWNDDDDAPDFRNTLPQLSADGRWIAQLHDEDSTLLFDVGTRRQIELPFGIWEAAWSPDNRTLAYVPLSADNTIRLYDVVTSEDTLLVQMSGAEARSVSTLIWSPTGSQLGFACCFTPRDPYDGISDGAVMLVDLATGESERTDDAQLSVAGGVSDICWTTDGRLVREGDSAETVICSDPRGLTRLESTTVDGRRAHWEAVMDADGAWQQARLIVTDTTTGTQLWERLVDATSVLYVAWSLDGNYLFFSTQGDDPIWRISAENDDLTIFAESGTLLGVIPAWQRPGSPTPTTPTPTPEITFAPLDPVATAAHIDQQMAFSPDGAWLAFWASSQEEIDNQLPATSPGGTLTLFNTLTGEQCPVLELHTEFAGEGQLLWGTDDSLLVTIGGETVIGEPCQAESFVSAELSVADEAPDQSLSADGAYQIETDFIVAEDGIRRYETRLINTDDDTVLAETDWRIDERLDDYNDWLGGEWVSPTQFVIYETLQKGPLLFDADEGVVSVLVDLLGMDADEIPSILDDAGFSLAVRPIPATKTDAYQLIIHGIGLEGNSPPLQIYHAATDSVEILPYTYLWWTPVVGDWLIVDARPLVDGNEQSQLWRRSIDDANGEWTLLAENADWTLFNEDGSQLVWTHDQEKLVWQSFGADIEIFGQYDAFPYWVTPVLFSADGDFVAAIGNTPGLWEYGLFILRVDQFED